ncbi:MAG: hypothetical protein O3B87_03590 [bacterium]|nr:hypothetical protein [bacterium]
MVKKQLVALLLIVLFIFVTPASAVSEAGSSARLEQSENEQKQIDDYAQYMTKKLTIVRVLKANNSHLVSEVDAFMEACITYELDCYLLPSITGLESSYGKFYAPDTYNPFGWGGGYIVFDSWADGIMTVGKGLRDGYVDQGLLTIEQIGPRYAESPTWAVRVRSISNTFEAIEKDHKNQSTIHALE